MEKVAHIGIDPGKTGFITLFMDGEFSFYPMPYHKVPTGELTKTGKEQMKSEFHEVGLLTLALTLRQKTMSHVVKITMEEVGGRGGWSATNNFNFGDTNGMLKMLCMIINGQKPQLVRPQKWQSFMRQGYPDIKKASSTGKTMISDPKAVAAMIVEKEYPNIDFRRTERATKIDDNKVDSFLICVYSIRTNI